jgi:hypothetical protein
MNDHAFYQKLQDSGNFLLRKDEVGKAKPSLYHLPPDGFAYGMPLRRDREGAGPVLSSWKQHTNTQSIQPGLDFIRINTSSIAAGCSTVKQVYEFRNSNEIRGRSARRVEQRRSLAEIVMAHGVKGKPSTPMDQVMSNLYGRIAEDEKHQIYSRPSQVSPTNSHMRYNKTTTPNIQVTPDLFKMQKFRNVSPRIQSYATRLPTALQKRRAQSSDFSGNK